MRNGIPLVITCMLLGAGILPAQQRSALGPPDLPSARASTPLPSALPTGQAPPALGPLPSQDAAPAPAQVPAVVGPPPTPYTPPPTYTPYTAPPGAFPPPYPPPPGEYVPMAFQPRVALGDPAGNPSVWVGVEALLWWTKNQPLSAPVITTGPASQGDNAGNLGAAGTTSLNGPLHHGPTGGVRIFGGGWFEASHTFGFNGSIFSLSRQSAGFGASDASGNGNTVINTPLAGAPFSTQVSAPGVDSGGVAVHATSRFAGGDINFLYNLYRAGGLTINLVGGYRYLELDESLDIAATSNMLVTATYTDSMGNVLATAPPGSTITVIDHFGTRSQFNGGQLGADFQYLMNRWVISGAVKLGIGATHEVITIGGATNVYPVIGPPVPLSGGNFATSQSGRYAQDRFALAPEATLSIGYQITPWMRASLGYNFLYLSAVARPGNQIDNTYDGVVHPLVPMASSSYWTQGIHFGLQFNY